MCNPFGFDLGTIHWPGVAQFNSKKKAKIWEANPAIYRVKMVLAGF